MHLVLLISFHYSPQKKEAIKVINFIRMGLKTDSNACALRFERNSRRIRIRRHSDSSPFLSGCTEHFLAIRIRIKIEVEDK